MKLKFLSILTITAFAFGLNGCSITLGYTRPEIKMAGGKPIVLRVMDTRPANEGGEAPDLVGNARNSYGMPYPIEAKGTPPLEIITDLVSDSLRSAGYDPVEEGKDLPILNVSITNMWFDGYLYYSVILDMNLELKDSSSSKIIWNTSVGSSRGTGFIWSQADIARLFSRVMNDTLKKMIDLFSDRKFTDAYNTEK